MAIFPHLELEGTVQVNDRTRLLAAKSFASNESDITKVEIEPNTDDGFIDVFNSDSSLWYLDWEYASDGTKTVTVRITTDGDPVTFSKTITVLTASDDALLSDDIDLIAEEPDIMKWVSPGRNSFLNVHRKARDLILDYLDEQGYTDSDGARLTKEAIVLTEEFRAWSKYIALRVIFDSISNSVEDVFYIKARDYEKRELRARSRVRLPIDFDGDGTVEDSEQISFASIRINRD